MKNAHVKLNPGLALQNQHQQNGFKLLLNHSDVRVTHIDLSATSCFVDGSDIATFLVKRVSTVLRHSLCRGYQHFDGGCLGLKYKHTDLPDSTFSEPYARRVAIDFDIPPFFLSSLSLVEAMALRRCDMKDDDSLWDYMLLHIAMLYDCETEVLGSDSDRDSGIPTTRPRTRFRFVPWFLLVKVASTVRGGT